MFEHKTLQSLDEYFMGLNSRQGKCVYFYRFHGYSEAIRDFIQKYYEAARVSGVIIEGRIPNPDQKNLDYYDEMMGLDFQLSMGFITSELARWLPRAREYQRNQIAMALYDSLFALRKAGKNENILKNVYIKFMCWLYYRFERIVGQLGDESVPKILYEGDISNYELKLLAILSSSGCDVVLLQYAGDSNYLKLDPRSQLSFEYKGIGMSDFPKDFSLKWMKQEMEHEINRKRLYGTPPQYSRCTNAWVEGTGLQDVLHTTQNRGSDPALFYNCFYRINGTQDKLTYLNELYQFQLQLKSSKRRVVIIENEIPQPSMEEINGISRKSYHTQEQMLMDLSNNIQYSANVELQRVMVKAFIDILLEEAQTDGMNLNKLTNKAVYLLCWQKRYQPELFSNWKLPEISCFIYLGGCKNENEAVFLRFLAALPIDVLILKPDLNAECCLTDDRLSEINCSDSLAVDKFPSENSDIHMGTAAYHAERELDTLMYQDSGMYRNQQYEKAVSVTLQTMYEEIALLWNQELKYRPNFSVIDSVVNLPVIFSKVSGVKGGQVREYWSGIKALNSIDAFIIKKAPFISAADENPMKAHTTEFYGNGRLKKARIKAHRAYQYGFLREEMQDYLLDKLQLLIALKTIKGTFENGTEYTIIATVLNLHRDILRLIQKFDFTKKNPKLIYINTTESMISLEDSIVTAFLNLMGFDIIFFVPTGYQNVEKFFNKKVMEEHQIGEYMYDLQIPDFGSVSSSTRPTWREKIFKRGN